LQAYQSVAKHERSFHGGVSATLCDAAVGVAFHRHLGCGYSIVTTDLKINYFLPVTEGRLFSRSHLLRIGKTLCVGRVDLRDERKQQIGIAIVTFIDPEYHDITSGKIVLVDGGDEQVSHAEAAVLLISRIPGCLPLALQMDENGVTQELSEFS